MKGKAMKNPGKKMTKAEAGRLGGKTTVKKHGKEWMRDIGRNGAFVTHSRYALTPHGTSDFAMVYRSGPHKGTIRAFISGKYINNGKGAGE